MDALKALQSMGMVGQTEGPDGDKLLQQAQSIWSMLDEMVDQDPASYSRFIEKQTKEYKEMKAPPQPHMCVKTHLQGMPLFVNIMSWQRVPKPKSSQDNIPLYAAPLDTFDDKKSGGTISTIAVTTNPEVLTEYGVESKNEAERNGFINLTLDYIQHLTGASVDRNFIQLPHSMPFKGDLDKAQKFFTDSLKKAMKKDKGKTDTDTETDCVPDIDLPDSMISRLANITTNSTSKSDQSNGSSHAFSEDLPIKLPETRHEKKRTKNLIQELKSEEVKLKSPKYSLERSSTEDCLVLRVELPDVTSVSQCQLDISEDDVKLYVEEKYDLTVQLPSKIDDGEARAKFSKKQSTLSLHMPLLQS